MQTTCNVHSVAFSSALLAESFSDSTTFSSSLISFALFFFLWPRFSVLPLLALLGKSWHQFWLQISWAARLHHVKIAIFLYLCRAIFKGSKVWRSRLAAWQERAHGYQHRNLEGSLWQPVSTGTKGMFFQKGEANVFLHIVGIWPQDQQNNM